jgi:hypothetical protein
MIFASFFDDMIISTCKDGKIHRIPQNMTSHCKVSKIEKYTKNQVLLEENLMRAISVV